MNEKTHTYNRHIGWLGDDYIHTQTEYNFTYTRHDI